MRLHPLGADLIIIWITLSYKMQYFDHHFVPKKLGQFGQYGSVTLIPNRKSIDDDMNFMANSMVKSIEKQFGPIDRDAIEVCSNLFSYECAGLVGHYRPVACIPVGNLVHDGSVLPKCAHTQKDGMVTRQYHGTRSIDVLWMILYSRGIMQDAGRNAKSRCGWYHTPRFLQALRYAGPTMIEHLEAQIILCFDCFCSNFVHPGVKANDDEYTKSGCLRYKLNSILLVPLYFSPPEKSFAKKQACMRFSAHRADVEYVMKRRQDLLQGAGTTGHDTLENMDMEPDDLEADDTVDAVDAIEDAGTTGHDTLENMDMEPNDLEADDTGDAVDAIEDWDMEADCAATDA